MGSQYQSEARFFGRTTVTPSGMEPYFDNSMQECNLFDEQFSTHGIMAALPANRGEVKGDQAPGQSFNPQLLARGTSTSGSTSSGKMPSSSRKSSSSQTADPHEEPFVEYKRAKFLERNRHAAAKCRTKKKEWTNNLEAAARQASQQTRELQAIVQNLRDEVIQYKTQLMSHQGCNCHTINQYLLREQSLNFSSYENGSSGFEQE